MQYTILYIRHLNQKDKCPARLVFGAKSSFWWPNPTCVRFFFQIKLIGFSKVAGNAVLPSHFELPMWPVTPWRFVMDVISPRMMWQKPLECFPEILSNLSVGITSIPTTTRFCTSQVDFSWFEPPSTVAKLQTSNDSAKRCRSERSTFWLSVKSLRTLLHCVLQDNAGHIGLRYIKGRNNGPVKTSKKKTNAAWVCQQVCFDYIDFWSSPSSKEGPFGSTLDRQIQGFDNSDQRHVISIIGILGHPKTKTNQKSGKLAGH